MPLKWARRYHSKAPSSSGPSCLIDESGVVDSSEEGLDSSDDLELLLSSSSEVRSEVLSEESELAPLALIRHHHVHDRAGGVDALFASAILRI